MMSRGPNGLPIGLKGDELSLLQSITNRSTATIGTSTVRILPKGAGKGLTDKLVNSTTN